MLHKTQTMKNTYIDLILQSYYFPQEGFDLRDGYLTFHGVSLKYLIKKYGAPFRLFYLPRISYQIKRAKNLFRRAFKSENYRGKYFYTYCTKSNHFYYVIREALRNDVHLETSSAFDIDLIIKLYEKGEFTKDKYIIHNGFKTEEYLKKIIQLYDLGFKNIIIVFDSIREIDRLEKIIGDRRIKVGIRMAIDQEPKFDYYTSRLGIRSSEIKRIYETKIKNNKHFEFKMFHFFVDSGILDTVYYWGEFKKALKLFVELKKDCPTLDSFNIGGGFPIRNNLDFTYDYEYMVTEIVANIKEACVEESIPEPHIFTEFGRYTVGESGAWIFEVLEQKQQNDTELWYIINNSLMNTMPDSWSLKEKFILLPINKWENEFTRVNIGGITCDKSDYYGYYELNQQLVLPRFSDDDKEPLYIGFFQTGAYQDAISGYGGIKHCLIPMPKYIFIDRDENGNVIDFVFREEQKVEDMLNILGYND